MDFFSFCNKYEINYVSFYFIPCELQESDTVHCLLFQGVLSLNTKQRGSILSRPLSCEDESDSVLRPR